MQQTLLHDTVIYCTMCGRYVQTSGTFVLWAAAHVVIYEA